MPVLFVRKGDKVVVITGKDKGKRGKILRSLPKKNRVIVEGLNIIKKNTRPTQKNPQGGIITKESPIDVSNVQLICPECSQQTRIGKRITSDGVSVRICKQCQKDIDK
ncbi:MAG: 50S ribosomal protein L24 [Actinobacteria bacterium]|nr:50S ribosomal protein L24 [Actinomycetota bacterium]